MMSTVTTKGQVTIPKPIRDAMGIGPNDRVSFIREGERILLQPIRTLKAFRGAVQSKEPGSSEEELSRAKADVAKRVAEEGE
jgi:antitoxin PrlF